MKLNKQMQKNCILKIKEIAIHNEYKANKNTIYKIENEDIVFCDFLIINSEFLTYRINFKKYSFDILFWKIMNMEENIKKGNLLRINGAFTAPPLLIDKGKIELSENIEKTANIFFQTVNNEVKNFLKKYDVVEYIFTNKEISDVNILKCLSYIDSNQTSKAKEIAKNQILQGDKGRFKNEGKGFFEQVLLYDD